MNRVSKIVDNVLSTFSLTIPSSALLKNPMQRAWRDNFITEIADTVPKISDMWLNEPQWRAVMTILKKWFLR